MTWPVWEFHGRIDIAWREEGSGDFPRYHLHLSCDACPVMDTWIGGVAVLIVMGLLSRIFAILLPSDREILGDFPEQCMLGG